MGSRGGGYPKKNGEIMSHASDAPPAWPKMFYHYTPVANLPAIRQFGLLPGTSPIKIGGVETTVKGVWLWPKMFKGQQHQAQVFTHMAKCLGGDVALLAALVFTAELWSPADLMREVGLSYDEGDDVTLLHSGSFDFCTTGQEHQHVWHHSDEPYCLAHSAIRPNRIAVVGTWGVRELEDGSTL